MRRIFLIGMLVWLVIATILPLDAALPDPRPIPAGGKSLLPEDVLQRFAVQSQFKQVGAAACVDAPDMPHGKVVRIDLRSTPREYWHAQIRWLTSEPVAKDRSILVRMLIRATSGQPETASGKAELNLQMAVPPWNRQAAPLAPSLMLGKWTWIDLPARSLADHDAGKLQIAMNLGYFPQTLEVADVQAYVFPPGVLADDLPKPDCFTYDGREADARWRAEAEARIEKHRKADMRIRVVDAAGAPVSGAVVSIRMKRHGFLFGTCVNSNLLREDSDGEHYREAVKKLFNVVVHEGAMKWKQMVWEGGALPKGRRKTEQEQLQYFEHVGKYLDWTEAYGIKTRGHTLVWPKWGARWIVLPPDLKAMVEAGDKEAVRREIAEHIRTAAGAFRGRLIEWDVVNESVDNRVLQDLLGREEIVSWFKQAKEADPGALAVLNDYCMLSGGAIPSRVEGYYDQIRFLLEHGAPIDAIGEQAHFYWDLPGIEQTYQILDRFAGFGLPMRITEFDVSVTDEQLQADYTRDFYTIVFSHPKVDQILMWGFWEGSHWQPTAAMFRRDWTPKPNYEAYCDLVFNKWWTNVDVRTDDEGVANARGFLGDYQVTAVRGDQKVSVSATLDRQGQSLTLRLP